MSKLVKRVHHLKGKPSNRRTKEDVRQKVMAAIKDGYTYASIAEEYGVSLSTVNRLAKILRNQ